LVIVVLSQPEYSNPNFKKLFDPTLGRFIVLSLLI
jgi:hypothetical protein